MSELLYEELDRLQAAADELHLAADTIERLRKINADLLAALQMTREQVDANTYGRIATLQTIDAAIAKAAGGEP